MKSITLAVILSGLISYATVSSSTPTPAPGFDNAIFAIVDPPLNADPDDDEDSDRIKPRHRTSNNYNRRNQN